MRGCMLWMVVAFVLALCMSCSPPKPKSEALSDPLAPTTYPQIATIDGLGRYVSFSSPSIQTSGDNRVSIVVPIRLMAEEHTTRELEYKFEFFHADGSLMLGENSQDWQFMRLPPRAQRYVKGSAVTTSPKNWRLLLRPAREE